MLGLMRRSVSYGVMYLEHFRTTIGPYFVQSTKTAWMKTLYFVINNCSREKGFLRYQHPKAYRINCTLSYRSFPRYPSGIPICKNLFELHFCWLIWLFCDLTSISMVNSNSILMIYMSASFEMVPSRFGSPPRPMNASKYSSDSFSCSLMSSNSFK